METESAFGPGIVLGRACTCTHRYCVPQSTKKPMWLSASPIGTGPQQEQAPRGHTEGHEGAKELDLPLTFAMQMFFA